jgi:hypothetical protein
LFVGVRTLGLGQLLRRLELSLPAFGFFLLALLALGHTRVHEAALGERQRHGGSRYPPFKLRQAA